MKLAEPTKFNRKSGVAQWRDLQFSQPAPALDGSSAVTFVIPTEAKRSGGISGSLNRHLLWMEAPP
jgi:hypothetical protein